MTTNTKGSRFVAAAIAAAALVGAGGGAATYAALGSGGTTVRQVTVGSSAEPTAATTGSSIADIVGRTAKGVVEITVTSPGQASPFGGTGQAQQAQGSGFVLDKQGHIVTNQHVVDGAQSVSVKFSDGTTYDATVVGTDPSTDLAVIKVEAPASILVPLQLGDSTKLRVGDGVVAIGSPFGLAQTVTTGIVSAVHREITAPNNYAIPDAIQTDAAINHGNSGGPLLDLRGRVVGVNSQIESDSGGNDGVGFAVPSQTVRTIVSQLLSSGKVEHAYLGVAIESIPGSAADTLGTRAGAAVTEVRSGSPAAAAGLLPSSRTRTIDGQAYPTGGDVITAVDGRRVSSADELRTAIDAKKPGENVELTVLRNGKTTSVQVTLASRPAA
ncbi:MAG TPA: trypsin-like peptidase domain-containing protein [Gaiellaceae bacterium]|nr:trypsin-like peptidase domain-containing protein [Gaiellaceae bacterium]